MLIWLTFLFFFGFEDLEVLAIVLLMFDHRYFSLLPPIFLASRTPVLVTAHTTPSIRALLLNKNQPAVHIDGVALVHAVVRIGPKSIQGVWNDAFRHLRNEVSRITKSQINSKTLDALGGQVMFPIESYMPYEATRLIIPEQSLDHPSILFIHLLYLSSSP